MPRTTQVFDSRKKNGSVLGLPAAALRAVFREGYGLKEFQRDLMAGLVVGIVALPLAMALAIAVGVRPQRGLYTAIVAGFIAAALGGSRTQVTGPTAAFIVILVPIYQKFGLAGLMMSGLLGGIMLLAMGLFRLGKLIEFVPHPVTTGFTAGIGTVIAFLQVKDFFGLRLASSPDHFLERVAVTWQARGTFTWQEFAIGAGTLALLIVLPKLTKKIPAPLIALPVAAVGAWLLTRYGYHVATIAGRFTTEVGGKVYHGIPQLPPMPSLPWFEVGSNGKVLDLTAYDTWRGLLPGAFAVAALGAIESLLSAVVADGMAQTRHDPDAELVGQGVANIVCPFFGGIPATGAIARTATNIRFGARSPIAAMIHALTILAAVLALAPLVGYLPMAGLAALLLIVAWNMAEVRHFVHVVRIAPRSDVAVLLTCYSLTVVFDMVVAVGVGLVLAAFLFMRRMAEVTQARFIQSTEATQHGQLPPGAMVYDIAGPLFFGAAQRAMEALSTVDGKVRVVILEMEHVPAMDATGLVALESALGKLKRRKVLAVISGLQPQPAEVLQRAGWKEEAGVLAMRDTWLHAVAAAAQHLMATEPGRKGTKINPDTSPGNPSRN